MKRGGRVFEARARRTATVRNHRRETGRANPAKDDARPAAPYSFEGATKMHENDKSKGTRTPTDDTAERLRAFYESQFGVHALSASRSVLNRLGRAVFQLARLAGIENPKSIDWRERHTIYTRAASLGLANTPAAQDVRRLLDEANERARQQQVERAAEEIRESLGIKHKPFRLADGRPVPLHYVVDLRDGRARNVGYIAGERIVVEAAPFDLKTRDAAAAWNREDPEAVVGRVVADDRKRFTLRNDFREERVFERCGSDFAGRIVGVEPKLSDDDRKRIDELRAKLDKLDREDDQIIRCTARYKIEKEIFEIEHQREGLNDWSAWETTETPGLSERRATA
jgi:hypothetical protein